MKIFYTLLTFITCLRFTLAFPLSIFQGGAAELKNYKESDGVIKSLPEAAISRRENVALTEFLTVLNQTGEGVAMVKVFCTNSLTQPTCIKTVVQYLKQENLTTLLTSIDQSELGVDLTMLFFENSSAIPGLITIIKALIANGTLKLVFKRDLVSDILSSTEDQILQDLIMLINDDNDLTDICVSLKKSGLAVSIVEESLSDSEMQTFVVKLVTQIIDDKIITMSELITALRESHLISHTVKTILSNSTDRYIIFKYFVSLLLKLRNYL